MIVYNVSVKIDPAVEKEWLDWQKLENIPDVMSTGFFNEFRFFKMLEQDETDGVIYVIQYFTSGFDEYRNYIEKYSRLHNQKALDKWGDQFVSFSTVMQIVN